MQKITVLCVGKLKEAFYEQAVKEYEKRLSRCCKLELLELPEQRLGDEPSEAEIRQALKKEAALVEQKLPKGGALIAMCIEGQEMSSVALSQKMQQLAARGASQLTFLIASGRVLMQMFRVGEVLENALCVEWILHGTPGRT